MNSRNKNHFQLRVTAFLFYFFSKGVCLLDKRTKNTKILQTNDIICYYKCCFKHTLACELASKHPPPPIHHNTGYFFKLFFLRVKRDLSNKDPKFFAFCAMASLYLT